MGTCLLGRCTCLAGGAGVLQAHDSSAVVHPVYALTEDTAAAQTAFGTALQIKAYVATSRSIPRGLALVCPIIYCLAKLGQSLETHHEAKWRREKQLRVWDID